MSNLLRVMVLGLGYFKFQIKSEKHILEDICFVRRAERALGKHGCGTDYGKKSVEEGEPGVTGSIAWENSVTTIVLKWTMTMKTLCN
ncbi:unnamed protein product [Prunus armeniaca]|uniref:Uncharacterized protein n=1 Tax=Prunus armeniaca TaxID=36596 RepID=A0A6J5Y023_PRUAR|nr:unnamed protein product [Prunus armeniaca]